MKVLLKFFGIISIIAAIIFIIAQISEGTSITKSGVYLSLGINAFIQAIVFLAIADILEKIDDLKKSNSKIEKVLNIEKDEGVIIESKVQRNK
jgi:cell shape-determining protein MreC